jgi:TRAP-type C4-dicarboxylate transport system permease small subunit
MFTIIAHAQSPGVAVAQQFVAKFNEVILFPIITLLIAVALLVFIWGCFQYIAGAANPATRTEGQKHIMWGIIGMFVMLTAYAILTIAANTFGLNDELDCANNPNASGCENGVFRVPK